jgi:hypothetical protein
LQNSSYLPNFILLKGMRQGAQILVGHVGSCPQKAGSTNNSEVRRVADGGFATAHLLERLHCRVVLEDDVLDEKLLSRAEFALDLGDELECELELLFFQRSAPRVLAAVDSGPRKARWCC